MEHIVWETHSNSHSHSHSYSHTLSLQIVHHLLSLYGTGAGIPALQKAFKDNASYQIRLRDPQTTALEELRADYASASAKYLGKGTLFPTWLTFFQGEMDARGGWEPVVKEYLFAETEAARDLQACLFAGLLHPIIQLLYGVEWSQPAIVASALAQTAVHRNEMRAVMADIDAWAKAHGNAAHLPFMALFEEVGGGGTGAGGNGELKDDVRWEDTVKIEGGVLTGVKDEALDLLSRVRVREDELEERTAEMFHAAAYVAASTTLRPHHVPKYDFFLM